MLKGKRVLLRPILKEDLLYLNKWKNTEQIFKYLGGGFFPVSKDTQEKWMDNIIDTGSGNIRYIIQINDKPIGFIGLYSIHNIHRTAELGIYIGEVEEQGKGYAYEAYRVFEDFIRRYLNIRKLKIYVVAKNESAVKFWYKCKFKDVGRLSKERYIDGKFLDLLIMEKFLDIS